MEENKSKISLDEIELHSILLKEGFSEEHKDQIYPLNKEASNYLWDFEAKMRLGSFYPDIGRYFKEVKEYRDPAREEKKLKKWLFNLGIPFKTKVFISMQPETGYVMTWKMVIKYSSEWFWAFDLIVWDRTLNWALYYHHDEIFHFGKYRVYNASIEGKKVQRDAELIADWNKRASINKKKSKK